MYWVAIVDCGINISSLDYVPIIFQFRLKFVDVGFNFRFYPGPHCLCENKLRFLRKYTQQIAKIVCCLPVDLYTNISTPPSLSQAKRKGKYNNIRAQKANQKKWITKIVFLRWLFSVSSQTQRTSENKTKNQGTENEKARE